MAGEDTIILVQARDEVEMWRKEEKTDLRYISGGSQKVIILIEIESQVSRGVGGGPVTCTRGSESQRRAENEEIRALWKTHC